jgi:23S rRNA (uracil1939-C5)-methyltransferase
MKRAAVRSDFRREGLGDVEIEPVRVADGEHPFRGYRNKAQYPLKQGKNGVEAGFYAAKTHTVIASDECALEPPLFTELVRWFCAYATRAGWSVYDETKGKGLLRHLYLRYGQGSGEAMVCVVVNGKELPGEAAFSKALCEAFPSVCSVFLNTNRENTNVVLGKDYRLLAGRPYLEDTLLGRTFAISPQSFYQVNHDGAELLYRVAGERLREACGRIPLLLDLYCGIGTIGLCLSDLAERVIGIEIVPEAVVCAGENAARNGVQNARFFCGDASDTELLLAEAERELGPIRPDAVILDPPRKGVDEALVEYLAKRGIPTIVYISCGPDTLARDCARFRKLGYEIGPVTPVNLFPRTGHCEAVCCLRLTK